jgi:hypothetical protein
VPEAADDGAAQEEGDRRFSTTSPSPGAPSPAIKVSSVGLPLALGDLLSVWRLIPVARSMALSPRAGAMALIVWPMKRKLPMLDFACHAPRLGGAITPTRLFDMSISWAFCRPPSRLRVKIGTTENKGFSRPTCVNFVYFRAPQASARSSARHCAGATPNSAANQRVKELGVA